MIITYDSREGKMIRFQTNVSQNLSIWQKIGLALSAITGLAFLFFFAITFLFVALGVGAVIFLSNLLFGRRRFNRPHNAPAAGQKIYRQNPSRDDDIIDI